MSEIKQVWGIIKNYQCADLKMVQDPALAVFQHQQAIIDNLKTQLNNMEACYIEKKKELEDRQKRIDDGLEKIHQFGKEGCLFPEWLIWAEKALRGES